MPLIKIEIGEGKKTKLYLVPKSAANAVATLLEGLDENDEGSVPAEDIFPDLKDPSKHPMITFRGIRAKTGSLKRISQNGLKKNSELIIVGFFERKALQNCSRFPARSKTHYK
jgi:hypothetical protein